MKRGYRVAALGLLLCFALSGCSQVSQERTVSLAAESPIRLSSVGFFRKKKRETPISVSPIEGTAGANAKEGYTALLDANSSTKWCVTSMDDPYVIFQTSEPVGIDGYVLVTANDTATYPGRNPTHWRLYGANGKTPPKESSSKWKQIDRVKKDKTITDVNETMFVFPLGKRAKEYQYYKLVIEKVRSGSTMQLSEFHLVYDNERITLPYVAPVEVIPDFEVTEADPKYFLGSTYIHNNDTFDLQLGDSVTLYSPMVPGSGTHAYGWYVDEGDSDCVSLDKDGPTCLLLAKKQGTVRICAFMSYLTVSGEMVSRDYTFHVNIGPRTTTPSEDFGSVADGHCPRCFGKKQVDTSQGLITCPWCQGSGKWTN